MDVGALSNKLNEWNNPVAVFCLGILIGTTFYFQDIKQIILIASCIAILILYILSKNKKVFLLLCAIVFGFFYTSSFFKLSRINLDSFQNQRYIYIGEIVSRPTDYNYYKKYELNLKNIKSTNDNKKWKLNNCKVQVTGTKYEEYEIGDIVQVTGKLRHPKSAVLPGLFDERKYLLTKSINYILIADKGSLVYLNESKDLKPIKVICRLREKLLGLNKSFLNEDRASLINGIIFGSKASSLNKDLNKKIQSLGLSHITSASGFNVSILAAGIFFIFNLLKYRKKGLPTIASICFILIYSAIAEFSASIIRATIFILILLIGNIFDKKIKTLPGISLILIGFFIFNPANLLDVGLQLSILGFLGLDLFASETINKNNNWFLNTLYQTFFAQVMVLPLIVFYFHNIQLLGLISNLVAIPLASIILIAGLLNITFFMIPGVNLVFQKTLLYSSGLFVSWVNYLNQFPFKQIYLPILNFYVLILVYLLLLFLLSSFFIKFSKVKFFIPLFIFLPILITTYYLTDTSRYFKIFFLKAYNQDSILIMPPKERSIFLSTNLKSISNGQIQEYLILNKNSSNTIYYSLKNNINAPFSSKYVKNENNKIKIRYKNLTADIIKNHKEKITSNSQYLRLPILTKTDPSFNTTLVNLPDTIIINDFKRLSKKSKKDILWLKSKQCKTLFLSETGTISLISDGNKTYLTTSED